MKTKPAVSLLLFAIALVYPTVAQNQPPQPEPFLVVPFAKNAGVTIGEGWNYKEGTADEPSEPEIHGYLDHKAIDFHADRGTPVYASADGYAYSSFMTVKVDPPRMYKGKFVGVGLGHFVEIIHDNGLRTIYGHLHKVAEGIPYNDPVESADGYYYPQIVHSPVDKLKALGTSIRVKRGDLIGFVGDSGLTWGYKETPASRPDLKEFPSWDETHTHFEVYDRDEKGLKHNRFDPFGLYGRAPDYQSWKPTQRGLWLTDEEGKPRFAR